MTARPLTLMAAFAAVLALTGCPAPEEQPKAEEKQAEQRKPQKSWSELIVGTWNMVKIDMPQVSQGVQLQDTFRNDGTYTTLVSSPVRDSRVTNGTYRLAGKLLQLTPQPNQDESSKSSEAVIESLTQDEMIMSAESRPQGRRYRMVFKRVNAK